MTAEWRCYNNGERERAIESALSRDKVTASEQDGAAVGDECPRYRSSLTAKGSVMDVN